MAQSDKNSYIVTFPWNDRLRGNGWVRIYADSKHKAMGFARSQYGEDFSAIYEEIHFTDSVGYFPQGCIREFDLD